MYIYTHDNTHVYLGEKETGKEKEENNGSEIE